MLPFWGQEGEKSRSCTGQLKFFIDADLAATLTGSICRVHVIKYGGQGQSGQTIKLFKAPRKISFTFHF